MKSYFNMKNGRNLYKVSAVSALQAKMINTGDLSLKALDKYTSFKERLMAMDKV